VFAKKKVRGERDLRREFESYEMIYRSNNVKTLMLIFSNERHMFKKFFLWREDGNYIHTRFILTLALEED
jgi:hypothetical protein